MSWMADMFPQADGSEAARTDWEALSIFIRAVLAMVPRLVVGF